MKQTTNLVLEQVIRLELSGRTIHTGDWDIDAYCDILEVPPASMKGIQNYFLNTIYESIKFKTHLNILCGGVGSGRTELLLIEALSINTPSTILNCDFVDYSEKSNNKLKNSLVNQRYYEISHNYYCKGNIHIAIHEADYDDFCKEKVKRSYDIILLFFIINFLPNWRKSLINTADLLKEDSYIWFTQDLGDICYIDNIFPSNCNKSTKKSKFYEFWKEYYALRSKFGYSWEPEISPGNMHLVEDISSILNNIYHNYSTCGKSFYWSYYADNPQSKFLNSEYWLKVISGEEKSIFNCLEIPYEVRMSIYESLLVKFTNCQFSDIAIGERIFFIHSPMNIKKYDDVVNEVIWNAFEKLGDRKIEIESIDNFNFYLKENLSNRSHNIFNNLIQDKTKGIVSIFSKKVDIDNKFSKITFWRNDYTPFHTPVLPSRFEQIKLVHFYAFYFGLRRVQGSDFLSNLIYNKLSKKIGIVIRIIESHEEKVTPHFFKNGKDLKLLVIDVCADKINKIRSFLSNLLDEEMRQSDITNSNRLFFIEQIINISLTIPDVKLQIFNEYIKQFTLGDKLTNEICSFLDFYIGNISTEEVKPYFSMIYSIGATHGLDTNLFLITSAPAYFSEKMEEGFFGIILSDNIVLINDVKYVVKYYNRILYETISYNSIDGLKENLLYESKINTIHQNSLRQLSETKSISSILSRNFSHNIGSHVMHNADMEKVLKKLLGASGRSTSVREELNAHRYAHALKSLLDRYIVQRNEYLADVSESTMSAGNYAKFYGEVVLPFVENFLLTDNIAAAEGLGFIRPECDNRLQIRVYINGKELCVQYNAELLNADFQPGYPNTSEMQPNGQKLHLPFRLPLCEDLNTQYDEVIGDPVQLLQAHQLESFFHTKKIVARDEGTGNYISFDGDAGDVEIALPGALGKHAFFSLLENFIRNSAKHNKEILQHKNLEVSIRLEPLLEDDLSRKPFSTIYDAWRVKISDNVSKITEDQFNSLVDFVNKPLIESQTGSPRRDGLGMADMAVSAAILAGSFDFDFTQQENRYLSIEKNEVHDDLIRYHYQFYLLKAKRIICLTNRRWGKTDNAIWTEHGITIVDSVDEMYEHMSKQAYRIALLDAELLDRDLKNDPEAYERLLNRLPFRIIVTDNLGKTGNGKYWRLLAQQRRLVCYDKEINAENPIEFRKLCWQHWLRLRYPGYGTFQLHLYLEHQHDRWEEMMKCDYGEVLKMHVWRNGNDNFQPEAGLINVIYDHHGRLLKNLNGKADFIERDSYTIFDKSSSDFQRIMYPDDALLEVLPYMMVESGLMRILVMDERVAERVDTAVQEAHPLNLGDSKYDANKPDTVFDLAWASGVHITTHYKINDMPARPLNDKSVQSGGSASEPRLTLHVKTEAGKSGKIRIIANLHRDNGNPYDVGEGHYDMLIIHRTILKHIQDEVKQNHDSAFEFLRDIKSVIPFVVLDSGGGYPDEIRDHYKGTFKFLPFSFVSEHLLQKRIAKVGLSQLLMGLTDAKQHD